MRSILAACIATLMLASPCLGGTPLRLAKADGTPLAAMVYQTAGVCSGIAVISHGAGGSEAGNAYLAQALSGAGWLAVTVGHAESGKGALRSQMRQHGFKGGLEALITDREAYEARLLDIYTARDWAVSHCPGEQRALLGHSMGAATVMMEAGAANRLSVTGKDSFTAYVALSPQGPGSIFPANAWRSITSPVLAITGTRDKELNADWQTRTRPFDDMQPGCKWMAVIDGASHMNLGGHGISSNTETHVTRLVLDFLAKAPSGVCPPPPSAPGVTIKAK